MPKRDRSASQVAALGAEKSNLDDKHTQWIAQMSFSIDSAELSWQAVKCLIRLQFPQVSQITPQQLALWLARSEPPLLLDARRPAEYQVSHLAQAQLMPDDWAELTDILTGIQSPVVVYCSVGYRSARAAAALQQQGITAFNLEGSIFEWANAGYPVYRGAEPVSQVHPYNPLWGRLLDAKFH